MEVNSPFDIALSYCADDAWVAKDLHALVTAKGLTVYAYDLEIDQAGGFLRDNLTYIYEDSCLNVLVWSQGYRDKQRETLVSMERRVIVSRHVRRGEDKSLLIVALDEAELDRDLNDILAHSIRREGVTGIAQLIVKRAKQLLVNQKDPGKVTHPQGTGGARGDLSSCTFAINRDFRSDPHNRWRRLADVLVDFPNNPLNTRNVYLIPSGRVNSLIRHSVLLRDNPRLLEWKRRATEEFAVQFLGKKMEGYWFKMRLGEAEVATVYSEDYDVHLNAKLHEFIRETAES